MVECYCCPTSRQASRILGDVQIMPVKTDKCARKQKRTTTNSATSVFKAPGFQFINGANDGVDPLRHFTSSSLLIREVLSLLLRNSLQSCALDADPLHLQSKFNILVVDLVVLPAQLGVVMAKLVHVLLRRLGNLMYELHVVRHIGCVVVGKIATVTLPDSHKLRREKRQRKGNSRGH